LKALFHFWRHEHFWQLPSVVSQLAAAPTRRTAHGASTSSTSLGPPQKSAWKLDPIISGISVPSLSSRLKKRRKLDQWDGTLNEQHPNNQ
jgi:hypothetical protein